MNRAGKGCRPRVEKWEMTKLRRPATMYKRNSTACEVPWDFQDYIFFAYVIVSSCSRLSKKCGSKKPGIQCAKSVCSPLVMTYFGVSHSDVVPCPILCEGSTVTVPVSATRIQYYYKFKVRNPWLETARFRPPGLPNRQLDWPPQICFHFCVIIYRHLIGGVIASPRFTVNYSFPGHPTSNVDQSSHYHTMVNCLRNVHNLVEWFWSFNVVYSVNIYVQ